MMNVCKDFLGKELVIGDEVLFVYQAYSGAALELKPGKVIGFTPQRVRLKIDVYYRPKILVSSDKIVKIKHGIIIT